jgi:transcriptional regulator with XRE-family HTH domain
MKRSGVIGFRPQALSHARKGAWLSQEQLAAALGVASSTVGMWEIGSASPRPATLVALANALGVGVDELLEGRPDQASLRGLRERAGLSIGEAAARLGIGAATVGRWERGTSIVPLDRCPDLAHLYGRSVEQIERLGDESRPTPLRSG